MINLSKFRYIYGFLILIILVGGIYIANIAGLWNTVDSINDPKEIVATGLPEPRGKYTLGEIIEAYNLNKEEFYEALKLPMDFPENEKVIMLLRSGDISYTDIRDYMDPIIEEFENK